MTAWPVTDVRGAGPERLPGNLFPLFETGALFRGGGRAV